MFLSVRVYYVQFIILAYKTAFFMIVSFCHLRLATCMYIEIISRLVSAYDFYLRVEMDR